MGDCGIISTGWAERFSLNSYCICTGFVMNGSLLTSYGWMPLYFNLVRATQVARKIASIHSLAGDIFLAAVAFPTSGGFGKMLPHLTFRMFAIFDLYVYVWESEYDRGPRLVGTNGWGAGLKPRAWQEPRESCTDVSSCISENSTWNAPDRNSHYVVQWHLHTQLSLPFSNDWVNDVIFFRSMPPE